MPLLVNNRNLVLIGFMGAGKSTVGAELARLLDYRLIDLDHLITERAGCPIREIFAQEGEGAFRELETATLKTLASLNRCVVATGGGIVGRSENWLAMRRLGPIVYLEVAWTTLNRRVLGDRERPLADQEDGGTRLRNLYESRVPLYRQADLILDCRNDSPRQVAERIVAGLES